MKILFLTQVLPYPLNSGPKIKTYYVLRYLAERGHEITLAAFVREGEGDYVQHLRSLCSQVYAVPMRRSGLLDLEAGIRSIGSNLPFLVTRDASAEMSALVSSIVCSDHFDIVHADQLTMAQFIQPCDGARSVFDAHNAVWSIVEQAATMRGAALRTLLRYEARRLKGYEGRLCRQVDSVLAVSEADRSALLGAGGDPARIRVVPIGIDSREQALVPRAAGASAIVSVSTLYYPPNADGARWFLNKVYPLVLQGMPSAKLCMIGARPPQDIARAAMRQPGLVSVPGYVADLRPYLEQAALIVVPVLAAAGMRVRILQALAQGIPVVTTTTGVAGIDAVQGEHVLIADTPQEFAQAVLSLLRRPEIGRRLAANGRRLVEERYDWHVVLPEVEQIYSRLREGVQ